MTIYMLVKTIQYCIAMQVTGYVKMKMKETDFLRVDSAVERPGSLKVLLHALLEWPRNVVSAEEVFEVPGLGLVDGSSSVHALYDGSHIAKHQSVHQRCTTFCQTVLMQFIQTELLCDFKHRQTSNNLLRSAWLARRS